MTTQVETDDRSRMVLTGHPNETFLLEKLSDGSMLLQPAKVVSQAQHEYDNDPVLRGLLARASASPTVRRRRERRPA